MLKNNKIHSYLIDADQKKLGGPELFQFDYKDKNVVDLACGSGHIGWHALYGSAKHVRFADAREQSFIAPNDYHNWSWEFIDLNKIEMLTSILRNQDIIMYSGHFYHATNHLEILDTIAASKCKEMYFETKMFHGRGRDDQNQYGIYWVKEETNSLELAWHDTEKSLKVGQPTFTWVHEELSKRFTIKDIKVIESSWFNENYNLTVYFYKTMVHCLFNN